MIQGYIIETLGDLRDHGMGLYAHCKAPNAGHGGRLDLDKLIEVFGANYVYIGEQEIGRRAVCQKCGHVGAAISVTANTKLDSSKLWAWRRES